MFDQTGHSVELSGPPKRIVSLVPSQTELLYHLGLDAQVVGITKFCVHPGEWFNSKTRVGGTKQVDLDRIRELAPDLIIANKEENTREDVEALRREFPVWVTDVGTVADALDMITGIGQLTGKIPESEILAAEIRDRHAALLFEQSTRQPVRVAYLIWKDPYMAAGRGTFIESMMHSVGWINVFNHRERYPETDLDELKSLAPEVVLLSSEPYPFNQHHLMNLQESLPGMKAVIVDGEYFSWYGSRIAKAFPYLKSIDDSLRDQLSDKPPFKEKA